MGNRNRYGELVEDQDDVDTAGHEERCVDGWLPDAPDGKAVPCLDCRPHLADARGRLRRRLEGIVR